MKEYTGGSVGYYSVDVRKPTTEGRAPYIAECNDLIEALGMNYAEGNAFKALWRRCAARMGKSKEGYKDGLYDAEKIVFFGNRLLEQDRQDETHKASDGGWIEWLGGERPVQAGDKVDVKYNTGAVYTNQTARILYWGRAIDESRLTIIAYRLSSSQA